MTKKAATKSKKNTESTKKAPKKNTKKAPAKRKATKPFRAEFGERMSDEEVAQNIETVLRNLTAVTKRGFANIKSMYLKLTMGNSIKLL